jgi:hypothetical protein
MPWRTSRADSFLQALRRADSSITLSRNASPLRVNLPSIQYGFRPVIHLRYLCVTLSCLTYQTGSVVAPKQLNGQKRTHNLVLGRETAPLINRSSSHEPTLYKPIEVLKAELKGVVDTYGDFKDLENANAQSRTNLSGLSGPTSLDPNAYIEPPPFHALEGDSYVSQIKKPSTYNRRILEDLWRLVENPYTPYKTVYAKYTELTYPHSLHLPYGLLEKVLAHLSVRDSEQRDPLFASEYMAILHEMMVHGVLVKRWMWDTAMHYLANDVPWIREPEIDSMINLWTRMEKLSGQRANHVTLTTMFITATKAGKYALADRLWRELGARKLRIDRVARVAQIYAYGIRKDGYKIRQCYIDLIDAGEIVDIVVINCTISALIKANEGAAAEEVFERTKAIDLDRYNSLIFPETWRGARALRGVMNTGPTLSEADRREAAAVSPISPNAQTYQILVRYRCHTHEDIGPAMDLLDEMVVAKIQPGVGIFSLLFKKLNQPSFQARRSSVIQLWSVFETAVWNNEDYQKHAKFMDHALLLNIIGTFARHLSKDAAREKWEEIAKKWDLPEQTVLKVTKIMDASFPVLKQKPQ